MVDACNVMYFSDILTCANVATGGMAGAAAPIIVLLIAFMSLSAWGVRKAFSSASFVAFISVIPLFAAGFTSGEYALIEGVLLVVGIFIAK